MISAMSFFPCLKSSTINFNLNLPAEMYVIETFSFLMSNIFLIRFTPSSCRHFISMFCFSSKLFFFFSEIFFIWHCLSFGIYFSISLSSE